ncbi:MAG: hypothetical protein GXN99_02125 [Candidatus Nanohaloarchaeota archaeon]|nr:hypothetical protein [Candidatus Nanohaloarchaeota archaeon]
MHRKGASIYIGAVLLIVITLSAGIFFARWYLSNVKEKARDNKETLQELAYCSKISLNFDNISFNQTGVNELFMYVENTGTVNVWIDGVTAFNIKGEVFNSTNVLFLGPYDKKPYYAVIPSSYPLQEVRVEVRGCAPQIINAEYIQQ